MIYLHFLWGNFLDFFAVLLCLILYPFKSSKLDLPKPGMENRPDILCVHGYLHNETAWGFYKHYLQKAGAGPVNTVYYPSVRQDIPQNSLKVKERIDKIKRDT